MKATRKEGFFHFHSSGSFQREALCSGCGSSQDELVGKVNYIGLQKFKVAQCCDCGLVSWDPQPSIELLSDGCGRLYRLDQIQTSRSKIVRGFARSYRLGTALQKATSLNTKKSMKKLIS
jgi:hypothetical protein